MTRIARLNAAMLANPRAALSFRDFERLLVAYGFRLERIKGSHRQYLHPAVGRTLPIQPESGDAKRYQVRQFLDMIEEYGLSMKHD